MKVSLFKLTASGAMGLLLGELVQQRAEQRALIRELEAEESAKTGRNRPAPLREGWVRQVLRKLNL